MPEILALQLRPHRLSDLFGQETLVKAIRNHVAKRPPHTWLFTGASGTGKTTLSKIMSIAYQCTHMKLWGDPCDECWKNKSSFAIHEINASDDTGVERQREVIQLSRVKPMNPDGKRVIVLNECHSLSKNAQDSILEATEEPPPSTIWILVTTDPAKLKDTLRRRCVTYRLKSLGVTESEIFLTKQATRAGVVRPLGDLFESCHQMQISSPALLLQALEKYAAGTSAAESVAGSEATAVDTYRICKAVTSGNWREVASVMKEAAPDDARWIRASVAGWLRGFLLKANTPQDQERAAISLLELSTPPYEEALMLHWLLGTLFKISKRYRV